MGRNSSNALMELRIALQFVQKLFTVPWKGLTEYLAARYMKCIVPYSSPEKLQYKHIDPFFSQELKIPILNAKKIWACYLGPHSMYLNQVSD